MVDRSLYSILVDIKGDNAAVVGRFNGLYKCAEAEDRCVAAKAQRYLWKAWKNGVGPGVSGGDWLRHEAREGNTDADALATQCIFTRQSTRVSRLVVLCPPGQPLLVQAAFDGGLRDGHAASAWMMKQWDNAAGEWVALKSSATYHAGLSAAQAETHAASDLAHAVFELSLGS